MRKISGRDIFSNSCEKNDTLSNYFLFSPFSILDTSAAVWQKRKRQWINLGIKSELGRTAKTFNIADWFQGRGNLSNDSSIFDPVLCELMYRWFCKDGGKILDPFAGGSVRGITASKLGFNYTGIELRKEQVDENISQSNDICKTNVPMYICGDSNKELDELPDGEFDFIFSCPPYADLEIYSDHIDDISNKNYDEFLQLYSSIINKSIKKLNDNRFAAFVVSEVRNSKTGIYRNFVSDTINCFINSGCDYYNEIILMNVLGSLPSRVGKQFSVSRKIGRRHQNILIFVKGDPKLAVSDMGIPTSLVDDEITLDTFFN